MDSFWWATGIEDTFVPQAEPLKRSLDEYELQQHYRFWREDLDLAASLGVQMMRYGIPWYKVNPAPGVFDWSWTDQVLSYMVQEKRIMPIIDLMHYGTPLWLENQFLHPRYPEYVAAYGRAFADRYRPLGVRYYTPLNEPFVTAIHCGALRRWPPYLAGDSGFVLIARQCAMGIIRTVEEVRSVVPDAVFVHVEASEYQSTTEPDLQERCRFVMDRIHTTFDLIQGRVDVGHPLYAHLTENGISPADLAWFRSRAIVPDIVGLNYYPELSVTERVRTPDNQVETRRVWGGAEALKALARDWYARHGQPIFITETSTNQKTGDRTSWLLESVEAVRELRAEGIPIIGYTWWPLYDLINWDYREGTDPVERYVEPMGLFALKMDFTGTFRREELPVADLFRQIVREGTGRVGPLADRRESPDERGM